MALEKNNKNIRLITVGELLIICGFISGVLNFSYQHINTAYEVNRIFAGSGAVTTATRNNFIVSGMVLITVMCFFFASLISLVKKKRFNYAVFFVFVLIVFGAFWTIMSISEIPITTVVKSPVSPVVMIMSICLFIGYDEKMWAMIKKMVFISSILYTMISTYEIFRFLLTFGFNNRLMLSGALYGIVIAIFLIYFNLLFNDELIKNHKIILLAELFLAVSITTILQSRSWVAHSLILVAIFVIKLSKNHKHRVVFLLCVVMAGVVIFFLASNYISMISQGLIDRLDQDSRTGQLKAFFSQVSFSDLMLGGGMRAGYSCFGDPNYQFLDNLLLLNMFKYGIVPTVAYLALMIVPIFYGLTHRKSEASKGIFFFMAWIVIMLGVGIFVSYSINIYNILIYVAMGRIAFLIDRDKAENKSLKLNVNARK